MYEELALLQKWSSSQDVKLKHDADEILEIRARELKYIDANRYANISNEIYNITKNFLENKKTEE